MACAVDIAAFILDRIGPMDAMKLQKLVYYGQAWSIALRGEKLFDESIQAWAFGPVTYSLFDRHRGRFVVADIGEAQPDAVTADERRLLEAMLSYYGRLDGVQLSEMTHSESPWQEARKGLADGMRSQRTISPDSMERYYSHRRPPFAW